MKAFRFPLERVLDWRRSEMGVEENKLRQLHAAVRALDQERAELEQTRARTEQTLISSSAVNADELHALENWRIAVRLRCEAIARRRKEREGEIAAQQQKLLEARRRYRLLDKLKERRLQEWRYELAREESLLWGGLQPGQSRKPVQHSKAVQTGEAVPNVPNSEAVQQTEGVRH